MTWRPSFQRRNQAVLAIAVYCAEEEPFRTKVLEARKPEPPIEFELQVSSEQQLD